MKKFSMKSGIGLLVTGALIAVSAGVGRADDTTTTTPATPATPITGTTQTAPAKKRHRVPTKRVNGAVVSATATSIVIKLSKRAGGGEKTFTVPDNAKILNGKDVVKLDSFTAGQRVAVTTLEDGVTVTRVNLQVRKAPATTTTAPATTAPAPAK